MNWECLLGKFHQDFAPSRKSQVSHEGPWLVRTFWHLWVTNASSAQPLKPLDWALSTRAAFQRGKKISLPEVVSDHSMRNQQLRGSADHCLLWFGEAPSCVCKTKHHQCPVVPGLHSYFTRAEYLEKSLFINLRVREESTLAKGRKDNVYRKTPLI